MSRKLNTTGTCWTNGQDFFSYAQQMTATYKGRKFLDVGFYSMTTRKHQGIIKDCLYGNYIEVESVNFNNGNIERELLDEITVFKNKIYNLKDKRHTQKKIRTIKEYAKHIALLHKIINE